MPNNWEACSFLEALENLFAINLTVGKRSPSDELPSTVTRPSDAAMATMLTKV